jgi:hypothetical protein
MKMNFGRLIGASVCAVLLGLATQANGISFDLSSSGAQLTPGNTTSGFFEVDGQTLVETGTAASLYSATLGGDEDNGFWVKIAFDSNPQPVLTSAFLKASNNYLWWDATDLVAFNAGTFDSITLWNSGSGGIQNKNGKYQGTSHAGLNGSPGTTSVPDGGLTLMLLGMALGGLGYARRLVK